MPFSALSVLAQTPLHLVLLVDEEPGLSQAALLAVWQQAQTILPAQRLHIHCYSPQAWLQQPLAAGLCLWLAEAQSRMPPCAPEVLQAMRANSRFWGGSGALVLWAAQQGLLDGARAALSWGLHEEIDARAELANLGTHLYDLDQGFLSCCGAAASLDFACCLLEAVFGAPLAARVRELLCVESVRPGSTAQRLSQARALPPKLSEVLALMQANIEEPLGSDDLANLVGMSRRQLERLFKQYLGKLPSRYYLELRLSEARQLLVNSHHSIVQVGLMCGFSSGSHFSTAFSALFGLTPREERQRRLNESF